MKYLPAGFQVKVTSTRVTDKEFIKLRALCYTKSTKRLSSQIIKRLFRQRINKTVPNTLYFLEVSNRIKREFDDINKRYIDHYDVTLCISARPCDIFTSKFFSLFEFGKK